MALRVNIDMSKIMQTPMIVNICRAWHDVRAIAHARTVTHANKKKVIKSLPKRKDARANIVHAKF